MKLKGNNIFLLMCIWINSMMCMGQQFPIQLNLNPIISTPMNFEELAFMLNGNVSLVANDTRVLSNQKFVLKIQLISNENVFSIKSYPKEIQFLSSNYQFDYATIASYLNINNYTYSNATFYRNYSSDNSFPVAKYHLKLSVLEVQTKRVVSNEVEYAFEIIINEPPMLINTVNLCDATWDVSNTYMYFQWMSYHRLNLNSNIKYEFQLYQLPEGVNYINPTYLGKYPIVFKKILYENNYTYTPFDPILQLGKKYAWRVRIIDQNNIQKFKNEGYSNVCYFKWGNSCLPPSELKAFVYKNDNVNIHWKGSQDNNVKYVLAIRPFTHSEIQNEWYYFNTTLAYFDVGSYLKKDLKYEYKVMSICGSDSSVYSSISSFVNKVPEVSMELNCHQGNANYPEDTITSLSLPKVGEYFLINGFKVVLLSSIEKNGSLSGNGYVSSSLFHSNVNVVFEQIEINQNNEALKGKVVFNSIHFEKQLIHSLNQVADLSVKLNSLTANLSNDSLVAVFSDLLNDENAWVNSIVTNVLEKNNINIDNIKQTDIEKLSQVVSQISSQLNNEINSLNTSLGQLDLNLIQIDFADYVKEALVFLKDSVDHLNDVLLKENLAIDSILNKSIDDFNYPDIDQDIEELQLTLSDVEDFSTEGFYEGPIYEEYDTPTGLKDSTIRDEATDHDAVDIYSDNDYSDALVAEREISMNDLIDDPQLSSIFQYKYRWTINDSMINSNLKFLLKVNSILADYSAIDLLVSDLIANRLNDLLVLQKQPKDRIVLFFRIYFLDQFTHE